MDTIDGDVHHARGRPPATPSIPKGASMTEAELRIIEFLMTPAATRPANLPD